MCLTLAETATTFTKFGIDTFQQVEDEIGTSHVQHLTQFIVSSIGFRQLQVIADSTTHQRVTLRYETAVTTHSNLTLRGLNKTENQAEHRCLANTRLAHNGRLRAGLKLMGEMVQYFAVTFSIAETHVFKSDTSIIHLPSSVFPLTSSLSLLQLLQTVDTGCSMNNARHHVQQLENRMLNHTDELQERSHHAKRNSTITQANATPDECQQITQSEGTAHNESCDNRESQATDDVAFQSLLHGVETVGHPLFTA